MPTAEAVPAVQAEPLELSEQWLALARTGQRTAIETVRRFVDTVDRAVPLRGGGAARRRQLIDGALEMADRLLHAQVDLLRHAVNSVVIVDVDVGVDVDVASRATRTVEGTEPAPVRG
jgi:hypothetical protein